MQCIKVRAALLPNNQDLQVLSREKHLLSFRVWCLRVPGPLPGLPRCGRIEKRAAYQPCPPFGKETGQERLYRQSRDENKYWWKAQNSRPYGMGEGCDVIVVSDTIIITISDTAPLDEVHTSKVQKHDDKDIHTWGWQTTVQVNPSSLPPRRFAWLQSLNWRGSHLNRTPPGAASAFPEACWWISQRQLTLALTSCGNVHMSENAKAMAEKSWLPVMTIIV